MNLIFLGPPGAGKGTLAIRASKKYSLPHISSGDLFREAIKNRTELGQKVQDIIQAGELVPDELTIELVQERLSRKDTENGFILDGFPRTIPQADALARITTIDKVIDLSLSDDEVVKRLSGRRVCRNCGRNFHTEYLPPQNEGICDYCGGELYTRDDDQVESIRNRLAVYTRQTAPLIEYYRKKSLLVTLDATSSPEDVFQKLEKILK